jgi:hypothetical protein
MCVFAHPLASSRPYCCVLLSLAAICRVHGKLSAGGGAGFRLVFDILVEAITCNFSFQIIRLM